MDFILIILWILILLVWYFGRLAFLYNDFFKDQLVKFENPVPVFGNIWKFVSKQRTLHQILRDYYKKYQNERIFGIFMMRKPIYVIRDPDLVKQITIKDFDSFTDHAQFLRAETDPMFTRSLPFTIGQKWKDLRTILSPVFTSNKMKIMFQSLSENAVEYTEYYENILKTQQRVIIDMKNMMAKFTISGIANCVFGMKTNLLKGENDEFTYKIRHFINFGFALNVKILFSTIFPKLYKFLRLRVFPEEAVTFIREITIDAMKYRDDNHIYRADVLQLMMEANKGKLEFEESSHDTANFSAHKEYLTDLKSVQNQKLSEGDIFAQGFVFFFAGFETTSTLLTMASYELAMNPEIQEELAKEIDEVLEGSENNHVTYEMLHRMKFLDMFVCEVLRKWPPGLQASNRSCVKPYTIDNNGTNIKLNPGDNIIFPVLGLHYDENYWPNPRMFDPYRFSDESKKNIHPGTYIPFGIGPRACLGSRFALMEIKTLLFYFVNKFQFCICEKTFKKPEFQYVMPPVLKAPLQIEMKLR